MVGVLMMKNLGLNVGVRQAHPNLQSTHNGNTQRGQVSTIDRQLVGWGECNEPQQFAAAWIWVWETRDTRYDMTITSG